MTKQYIAVQSGGLYGDSCRAKDWIKSGESFVIEYRQFEKFINGGGTTPPLFVFASYADALAKAKELNSQERVETNETE